MSKINQYLKYLERQEVVEVVFQTSKPPAVRINDRHVPVSKMVLTPQHMLSILKFARFTQPLPTTRDAEHKEIVSIGNQDYAAELKRQGSITRLSFRYPQPDLSQQRPVEVELLEIVQPSLASQLVTESRQKTTPGPQKTANRNAFGGIEKEQPTRPVESGIQAELGQTSPADLNLCKILRDARRQGASDVHVISGQPVSMRFASKLRSQGEALPQEQVESMLMSIMNSTRREQLGASGSTDFAVRLNEAGPFRVNVGRNANGLKGSFRVTLEKIPTLHDLGLPEELSKVTMYHQGLAIVSGPSGHGKTTTLSTLVNLINTTKAQHIITVEDPVEFIHPVARSLVSQREVGTHTKSFVRALKGALREDPDVIVIGELRDLETVEIALEAAETGHLVITTMNTRSGPKTIDRLIDMFPPDKQSQVRATLAGALKIVVSQRLLPSADGQSMVAAAELITGNIQLWNLIRDNKLIQLPSLMQRGLSLGMIRFDASLQKLVQEGLITQEVALSYAENPAELQRQLQMNAPAVLPRAATG